MAATGIFFWIWIDVLTAPSVVVASVEKDHKQVFSLTGRGRNTRLRVQAPDGKLINSDLLATDLAANICPVGAILHKQGNYSQRPR